MFSFLVASFAAYCSFPLLLQFIGLWGFLGAARLVHYIIGGVNYD